MKNIGVGLVLVGILFVIAAIWYADVRWQLAATGIVVGFVGTEIAGSDFE